MPSVKIDTLTDRTETIRASIADVQFTLLLTVVLVVMTIFIFLRKFWATVIPSVALPLAVIGLGLELGIELKHIRRSLEAYKGAGRRLEIRFQSDKYLLIDDYAHHPTEIKVIPAKPMITNKR